jgi:SAM-dependent methyltransferase
MADAPKPEERFAHAELRYRIADAVNDWLKTIPGAHVAAKKAGKWAEHWRDARRAAGAQKKAARLDTATVPSPAAAKSAIDSASLPIPPFEMRQLVGPTELGVYDNPTGSLVYPYLAESTYESILVFGCGCGRVARQLILQRPRPARYVRIDLHAGMIEWCNQNLRPAAPEFSFYHHDVFNVLSNPDRNKPLMAPFPSQDSQFTLINALSVFTHLTQEQAEYYLRECARVLAPNGVLHASWFLFDKADHPMMSPVHSTLYVSYTDPSAAVLFDRDWLRNMAAAVGLRIFKVLAPGIRGYQWLVLMTPRMDLPEADLSPDTAPRGIVDSNRVARAIAE